MPASSLREPGTVIVRARERHALDRWRLTELDTVNNLFVLRGAWVFDRELDAGKLVSGLEQVLSFYPHLAGRMVGARSVDLNNAGVPFSVQSRRSLAVSDLRAEPSIAHRFADRLHPILVQRGLQPLLKVRLTRLRDGTLLTVSCSHLVLDGSAFYTFVRNWSWCCQGRRFPTPVLDPSLVPAPLTQSRADNVREAEAEGWCRLTLWTLLRVVLYTLLGRLSGRCKIAELSPAALRRMRRAAKEESSLPDLRTFEALSAHLTRMCARLVSLPTTRPCGQVTVLDLRRRVASLPADYCANAAFAVCCRNLVPESSLGEFARQIHQALDPILCYPSPKLTRHVALARALVAQRVLVAPYDLGEMQAPRPTITYINNFWTLPVYEVDFGEEGAPINPVIAIPHDLPDPVLIWPAPPAQGGVEVYFTGRYARAAKRLPPDHPWWADLRQFESAGLQTRADQ